MANPFAPKSQTAASSIGLLVLRVVIGVALVMHGWPKVEKLTTWMGEGADVPAAWLQALAVLGEVGGGIGLALGFLTPLAALGALCVMATAIYFHSMVWGHPHLAANQQGQPYNPSYELALSYFAAAFCVLLCGPGKASVDHAMFGRK